MVNTCALSHNIASYKFSNIGAYGTSWPRATELPGFLHTVSGAEVELRPGALFGWGALPAGQRWIYDEAGGH